MLDRATNEFPDIGLRDHAALPPAWSFRRPKTRSTAVLALSRTVSASGRSIARRASFAAFWSAFLDGGAGDGVDQRHVAEALAVGADRRGVMGAVHQVPKLGGTGRLVTRDAVIVARGMATWLSWRCALVEMQLIGISPSATSICSS